MAEGGSSPLGDPGGLHLYNLNGGPHKMAELVADNGGPVDLLAGVTSPATQMSYSGSPEASPYGNSLQGFAFPNSYDAGFEDMKRATHIPSSYYHPMESSSSSYMTSHGSMFEMPMQGFSPAPELYKSSAETVGYTEILPKANNLSPGSIAIKKEKLDFSEQLGMINSHNSDIPYPPNTCVADWNYFNSMNTSSAGASMEQPQFNSYPPPLLHMPSQQQYHAGQFYPNTNQQEPTTPLGLSNEDIHHQSKTITQSIINSEWSNDTMYKSQQMYPGYPEETVNKKRRAISDKKGKDAKSRRKKVGESGDKSARSLADRNNGNLTHHENILDSGERNTLVTALMNNLRSTVQFESFCLSLPRSPAKESAFHNRVNYTADMIRALGNKPILSNQFPPSYIQGAEKVISSFKKALNNMGKVQVPTDVSSRAGQDRSGQDRDRVRNLSCDQVEEHIPHSMVWVLKVGDTTVTANWEGQFVATVNPVQNTLSCSIFQYSPSFTSEGITSLQQCRLSKQLAQDILSNMEQFEVSRQLRFDVNLKEVVHMYLYTEHENAAEGCLLLEVSELPDYFQRWLHTSAEDKNKWRRRSSFFQGGPTTNINSGPNMNRGPGKMNSGPNTDNLGHFGGQSPTKMPEIICIGGLSSELNEVVALILASNPELRMVYEVGLQNPYNLAYAMQYKLQKMTEVSANGQSNNHDCGDVKPVLPANDMMTAVNGELRRQIKQVIVKHGIRLADNVDPNRADKSGSSDIDNEIILDTKVSGCFRDYINYTCKSATELDTTLCKKVSPSLHGFYDNDFKMSLVPGGDLEQLTVGQLISTSCSEVVYYSFCRNSVGQLGHDVHCSRCRKCVTYRFQHCDSCNRCSEVKSICELCGVLRHDQTKVIIKPLSVFRSELKRGTLEIDHAKDNWLSALGQPDNDVLSLNHSSMYIDTTAANMPDTASSSLEYNSSNAMVDQLGLLNPVGFLLGQGAAGATRKHRRYKGMQPIQKLDSSAKGGNSTGGCVIQ